MLHTMILLLLLLLLQTAHAYTIELQPGEMQCYQETLKEQKDAFVLGYQVQDGPDFELDMNVLGPKDQILYDIKRASSWENTIEAAQHGTYVYYLDY